NALGRPLDKTPLVIQYNKRDLADAVPIPVLDARLKPHRVPYVEAVASDGTGVMPTLREISKLIVARLYPREGPCALSSPSTTRPAWSTSLAGWPSAGSSCCRPVARALSCKSPAWLCATWPR